MSELWMSVGLYNAWSRVFSLQNNEGVSNVAISAAAWCLIGARSMTDTVQQSLSDGGFTHVKFLWLHGIGTSCFTKWLRSCCESTGIISFRLMSGYSQQKRTRLDIQKELSQPRFTHYYFNQPPDIIQLHTPHFLFLWYSKGNQPYLFLSFQLK